MGNRHSSLNHKSRITRHATLESTKSVTVPAISTSTLPTPGLSRSSSKTTSRPPSIKGDVKDCGNKVLDRSTSTLDVTSQSYNRTTPRRSFSAPADCFDSTLLHSSSNLSVSTTKYCLPTDEKEQDRLTNTVNTYIETSK